MSAAVEATPNSQNMEKERTSGGSNRSHIRMSKVNTKLREVLKQYDKDGDQKITRPELEEVINHLVREQFQNKIFLGLLLGLVVYFVLLLGSLFALTWAVMLAQKDTEVSGNTWVVKGTSTPISLGMSDISVANSSLVLRGSGGGAGNSSSVTRLSTTVPTVKMAVYEGVSYDDLLKIDHIVVQGMQLPPQVAVTAQAKMSVLGVTRAAVAAASGATSTALRVETKDGVLVLQGGAWYLEGTGGMLLAATGMLGSVNGQRAPIQGPAAGESYTVYGYSTHTLNGAASASCTSRVNATSCGAAYTACGSPTWPRFTSKNFALCEKANYSTLATTASFCC
ncbi:hypothetical protein CHLRE_03g186050v5 [Chlamydomonas reinhardtii]|uniref:EF-hand domain-containing protein n=1 Tax=Chlamydomonas reinhardtii TaxID=3055 RepID=A0A2K3DY28_CHLRE|nr:uncharacterized protein CHLRE_03g186050v5 [Chlamydomonas reinhardtii]PNW85430.1 hypothetical protein CHLRE_03g186050v5 [Chlamydomonas reinhardtii]